MTAAAHGDERLAARLRALLGPRHGVAAAAVAAPEGVTTACLGTGLDADFEIGSISKGITGLLYAEATARGEIGPDTVLGDLLPLGTAPVGRVSLRSLSTHRSGLPSLPASAQPLRRTIALWRRGANPYGEDLGRLLEQARKAEPGKPRPRYSNFGFELLGHALAAAADTDYAALLRQRITVPLGLDCCYAPAAAEDLRPEALTGTSRRGRPRQPWTGEAVAPAGGIRASITAMARLTEALLDGTAPGLGALDPVEPFGVGARIGAAWVAIRVKDRTVTWHNGGTGGFRSWLGLDREAGTGAVILSATSAPVDRHGLTLLTEGRALR